MQILSTLIFLAVASTPIPEISWEEVKDKSYHVGEKIRIRGFVYSQNHSLYLAEKPDLKSCCIGNIDKHAGQLKILGSIPLPKDHQVVLIEGLLTEDGIENSTLIEESFGLGTMIPVLFILLTGMVMVKCTQREASKCP